MSKNIKQIQMSFHSKIGFSIRLGLAILMLIFVSIGAAQGNASNKSEGNNSSVDTNETQSSARQGNASNKSVENGSSVDANETKSSPGQGKAPKKPEEIGHSEGSKETKPSEYVNLALVAILALLMVSCVTLAFLLARMKKVTLKSRTNPLELSAIRHQLETERMTSARLSAELDHAQTARFNAEASIAEARRLAGKPVVIEQKHPSRTAMEIIRIRDWIQTVVGSESGNPALPQLDAMLRDVLKADGIVEATSQGLPYDTSVQSAVSSHVVSSPAEAGFIHETIRAGYRMGDILIRPEEVVVTVEGGPR